MKTEKQKKRNRLLLRYLFVGFLLCFLIPHYSHADGPFEYQLLEQFPGFYAANSTIDELPAFMLSIYKFGIWTVGIAGLLMLTIGGFMYMGSAGNTSIASNAKKIIQDSIIGIVVAMCAYLILYIINPDLASINIAFSKATVVEQSTNTGEPGNGTPNTPPNTPPTTPPTNTTNCGDNIINKAKQDQKQKCIYSQPKRNGCTTTPGYTDCSDLVDSTFKSAGCKSPGNNSSNMINKYGQTINKSTLKKGDVIGYPGHVGICAVDGCATTIAAKGTGREIGSNNLSWWLKQPGVKVIPAASMCPSNC
jgi:hypothetical protein